MKKFLAVLLTIVLIISVCPLGLIASADSYEGYTKIYTAADLYSIRNDLTAKYILMNDIDLTEATAEGGDWDYGGRGWNPIGSNNVYGSTAFSGIFDGNGYTISGMRINITTIPSGTGSSLCLGLFANNAGTIKNLHIEGAITMKNGESAAAGGVAAINNGVITACSNAATITMNGGDTSDYTYVGGIVGKNYGTVEKCYNTGEIKRSSGYGDCYVGGISGYGYGDSTIENCYNIAAIYTKVKYVSGYGSKYGYAGGIQGYSPSSSSHIKTSYNIGAVTATCYDYSSAYNYAITYNNNEVQDCYYLAGAGNSSKGATALTAAQMELQFIFSGFDFDNVWTMGGDADYLYPELQCFAGDDGSTVPDKTVNSDGYIEIRTIEDLYSIRNDLTAKYILMNDIDLTEATAEGGDWDYDGRGWNPIGSNNVYGSTAFSGIFDGNGYTISGMRINITTIPSGTGSSLCLGLFANNAGTIKNLHIEGAITMKNGESAAAGGVAAINNGVITACSNAATITMNGGDTSDYTYVGGIVGKNYGTVEKCYNTGEIKRSSGYGDCYVGGISGYGYGDSTIENCYNIAAIYTKVKYVSGYGSKYGYAGGIQGYSPSSSSHIKTSYNIGAVTATCYDYSSAYNYAITYNNNEVQDCYYLAGAGNSSKGATALTAAQMELQFIFSGFDFDNVWTMGGDADYLYPELQCFALSGKVGIIGDVAYLSTAEIDLSGINKIDDSFTYEWIIDGVCVGTGTSYTFTILDIGKKVKLKVTGTKEYNEGTIYSEEITVSKAVQPKSPVVPELLLLTDSEFEISTVSTQEYSIDGVNWQKNGVFENLDPNKKYTVYSRILENDLYLLGSSAKVLELTTDRRALSGSVAIVGTARYGDTLTANVSAVGPNGVTFKYEWKSGGVVVGTGKTYTITKEDIGKNITVSVEGTGNYIGTLTSDVVTATKTTVQLPNAPVVSSKTNTSVTLVTKTGYEYSKDKITWQSSPVFNGLSAATEYTFYQRIKETDTTFASSSSSGTKVTTLKNTVSAPAAPVIDAITNTSVTLKKVSGYEYSKDGLTWQSSNVFTGLNPFTEYSFCQRIAETATDYASAQSSYTLVTTLKNTISAPAAPTVSKATDTTVTLTAINGFEYSVDGTTWQKSNVFSGLTVLNTYKFYQRVAETDYDYASATSNALSFKVKNVAPQTAKPVIKEVTNNKIVIETISGLEYSVGGTNWQTGGTFVNLQPNTKYNVYARTPETDTHYAGSVSDGLVVTTLKNTVAKPSAPTVSSKTANSVTLTATSGYEYSKNGTTWQTINVFSGLSPNTTYTFYQRVAETNTNYVSEKSNSLSVTTLKNTVAKPSAPTVSNKTANSVTLTATSGYEYSKDGTTWQTSNVFSGLSPNTTYTFYQRVAETNTSYVSDKSVELSVTTNKKEAPTPKAPIALEITATTIKLAPYTGYEYSKDGVTWQKDNKFTGLVANTSYTFYQRLFETNDTNVSTLSSGLKVATAPKASCSILPISPIVSSVDTSSVTLVSLSGYEYSRNGTSWQSSPTFTGLSSNSTYTFYQRIKETDKELASNKSAGVSVKTLKTDEKNSYTYYDMLRTYINNYGSTSSDGYKTIIKQTTSGSLIGYYVMQNKGTGIYFCFLTTSSDSSYIGTNTEFTLSKTNKNISVDFTMVYYYGGTGVDAVNEVKSIDRSTYSYNNTYSTTQSGRYIKASDFKNNFNQTLQILTKYWDVHIYENLGFGLEELGFLNFIGLGTTACDIPSSYHKGTTETRNYREAGCVINGYTGDKYCTFCNTKLSSGTTIYSKGSHSYDNSCDKTCNDCGEERYINHTYKNSCDHDCDICGIERTVSDHIHDNDCDSKCNECDLEREAPHIYDDSKDLICNGCGYERPPYTLGDVDGSDEVTDADAEYLLMYTFFPEDYPVNQTCDFNGDGFVNDADAEHLLMYTFFPDDYPLN